MLAPAAIPAAIPVLFEPRTRSSSHLAGGTIRVIERLPSTGSNGLQPSSGYCRFRPFRGFYRARARQGEKMSRHLVRFLQSSMFAMLAILALSSAPVSAQSDQGVAAMQFGIGQPQSIGDLPPGQLRRRLESLPPQASARALKWLQEISFTGTDLEVLQVDDEGGVYFADTLLPDEALAKEAPVTPDVAPPATLANAFLLHSRPGATNRVYLDFNGHSFTNTAWSSGTINAVAYSLDADRANFSDTERGRIVDIWHRVAEDLAPFNIDVTTEQPASFNATTGRILVTEDQQADGSPMPSAGAGGVAYVNVFGQSNYHTFYSPALVYADNLGSGGETYVAEASSHEFGHNLGLSHDGTTSGTTYYAGHGSGLVSWAPIMGNSYYNNVTEWSKGEYAGANQTQDDLAIITAKLGLKPDDHGNTIAAGTALQVSGAGAVVSSNPELDPFNTLPDNKGVINSATDVDVFTFVAAAGPLSLSIRPSYDAFYRATERRGSNLDIGAELRDAGGVLVASSEPGNDTQATLGATVVAGTYHLLVTGVGNAGVPYSDYDSLGQYFINGTITTGPSDTTAPTPNPMGWASVPAATGESTIAMIASTATDETSTVQYRFTCTSGGAGCVTSAWQASPSHTATGLAASTQYTWTVAARDLAGNVTAESAAASASTQAPPPPPPFVDVVASGETAAAGSVSGAYTNTHTDNGSAQAITEILSGGKPSSRYSLLEHRWSFSVGSGATVTVFANAWSGGSTDGDSFDFQYSLDGGGSWSPMFNVSSTGNGNVQSFEIPGAPGGAIQLRVIDTNRVAGAQQLNTVSVDHLYIQVANPPSDPPDGDPSGLSATAVSASRIDLAWTDGASNETSYLVERSADGIGGWAAIASLGANSQSYSNIGLAAATTYFYRVSAVNLNGSSGYASANATTFAPPPPPAAPTGLTATGVSASGIDLAWTHAGSDEAGFRVERSAAGAGTWSVVATLAANAVAYSDTGLAAATSYDYRVAAFNGGGDGVSSIATGTTLSLPAVALTANGYKSRGFITIDLGWTGVTGVDVYRNGNLIASGVGGSTYTDNTGLKGGGTFTHRVCEAGGTTNCSNLTTTVF